MNVRQLASRVETTQPIQQQPAQSPIRKQQPGTSFADMLRKAQEAESTGLQVSAHAQQRIQERGIGMDELQQRTIIDALTTLDAKGAQDALLLRSDAAFVVNVPNRTVVTAIGREEMAERVFTNIDSAMVL